MPRPFIHALAIAVTISAASAAVITPTKATLDPQPDEDGRKVWYSRSFRIDSDIPLSDRDLQRLAIVADTTARAVAANPLPLFSPPQNERPRLAIYGSDDDYHDAGATQGTAGMYLWRKQLVVLNAKHLFPEQTGSKLQPIANEDLAVHEIVHLCMHRVQAKIPQWLSEGICEYFAAAHLGAGRFDFDGMERRIREHLKARYSPRDPKIQLVPVDEIIGLSPPEWLKYVGGLPAERRHQAYTTALLLAHYHLNGGKNRRDQVISALEFEARGHSPVFDDLGKQAPKIEDSLKKFWAPKGLQLEFVSENPAQ